MTRPFSETERHTQHAALRATHSAEISAALDSTRALAADRGLPLTLGDTLLNDPL